MLFALVLAEALALFQIWKLNMLPGKYFLVVAAVMLLLIVLIGAMLLVKSGKYERRRGLGRQIAGYLLSAVIIAGCTIGFAAVAKLNDTMSSITGNQSVSTLMDVYVLADNPAQSISDAGGYIFGLSETTGAEDNQAVVDEIRTQLGSDIETHSFETAFAMIDALYAGQVDAVILDSAYVGVLEEVEGYTDFAGRTRLLFEHIIEKKVAGPEQFENEQSEVVQPVKDVTNTPFLLYISGNDARKALIANGGSDVNILVAVNPTDKQVLLVNTPRDYYVGNPAGNGAKDKLSHCGLAGIENSVTAMSDLYGQDINYYAKINFSGFKTLVDAIGGVTVYSDVAFSAGGHQIVQGENHLNGTQALAFARERKALSGGDNDRGKNQMKLIAAMINQLSAGNLLANYGQILDSLEGMFAISMSADELASLVRMQLADMSSWDILSFAVTGDNGNDTCYAVGGGYGYVMYPHENVVAHASGLIGRVLSGEVLTQEDLTVS